MAERDITGQLATRSLAVIQRLRQRMQDRIPYGPTRENLTSLEARKRLQAIDPLVKAGEIQRVGDVEWARMMQELYGSYD